MDVIYFVMQDSQFQNQFYQTLIFLNGNNEKKIWTYQSKRKISRLKRDNDKLQNFENIANGDENYNEFNKLKTEAKETKVECGKHMKYPDSYLRVCYLYKEMYKLAQE